MKCARLIPQLALVTGLVLSTPRPAATTVGVPVSMTLASPDTLRRGEPLTVIAVLRYGEDFPQVVFEIEPSADWQILDGTPRFVGNGRKGQRQELRFRAVPLSDTPEPLRGVMRIQGRPERLAALDPARLGGHFFENGRQDGAVAFVADRAIPATEEIRPEPAAANPPRTPGVEARAIAAAASAKAASRDAAISASGRFVYQDDQGVSRGVRNATVELMNFRFLNDTAGQVCGRDVTDGAGRFSITAACSGVFGGPMFAVRVVLNNSVVEVKPEDEFAGTYTFQSATKLNVIDSAMDFGIVLITANQQAFQTHNLIMRGQQFMASKGETVGKVTVLFPSVGRTTYIPEFQEIHVERGIPFSEEGAVYHVYGHHILTTLAESPTPDFENGICDQPGNPGHCVFAPENGFISWTEGWPDFFAAMMHDLFNSQDGYGPTAFSFETQPDTSAFGNQQDHIEGVVAAVLWDLFDSTDDDQFAAGEGRRDHLSLGFDPIWNVIRNFDPGNGHTHPVSIHDLWDGLRATRFPDINRVSEVYREHNILKPQPDLEITSITVPPARVLRGSSFTNISTVHNRGDESASNSFTVGFRLVPVPSSTLPPVALGTRSVPAGLIAGSSSTGPITLTIPAGTAFGVYNLQVCADSGHVIPESVETNNCSLATGTITVVP